MKNEKNGERKSIDGGQAVLASNALSMT